MGVTVDIVKCACSDCVGVVNATKGLECDGRVCCGESCAEHHTGGAGCNHAGCTCHG